jgi:hypothetical protein
MSHKETTSSWTYQLERDLSPKLSIRKIRVGFSPPENSTFQSLNIICNICYLIKLSNHLEISIRFKSWLISWRKKNPFIAIRLHSFIFFKYKPEKITLSESLQKSNEIMHVTLSVYIIQNTFLIKVHVQFMRGKVESFDRNSIVKANVNTFNKKN